jgi:hypothetical protein
MDDRRLNTKRMACAALKKHQRAARPIIYPTYYPIAHLLYDEPPFSSSP